LASAVVATIIKVGRSRLATATTLNLFLDLFFLFGFGLVCALAVRAAAMRAFGMG
jgi:hypothetical protein